jgi:glutamine synthetase
VHLSLADSEGRNVFAAEEPAGTPLLRHAIGGLAATAPDSFLLFAPNANSYRRFRARSYAPVAVTWGVNNRSVSLRVPAGPAPSRHVEHRFSGADANLYLVTTAVIAGALHGIERRLDPGEPVVGNGYEAPAARRHALPGTWQEAIERAASSAFLQEALGEGRLAAYIAVKRQECERFAAQVTELDLAWYLRNT